ncbi:Actin, alpha cardiac muscle 2, partial [Sciurus carolinensis]|nr:Actin, alpha cardiac muscle 2 [Sciurus carolinensis]
VICDYGSGCSKAGFAGSEAPHAVFPTVLGKLRHDPLWLLIAEGGDRLPRGLTRCCVFQSVLVGMEEEDWFIGEEAQNNRGMLNLQYPISRGTVTSWDNLEKIWHHSFYHVLHVAPEQHPLMVTEPPLSKISTKEKVSQILFETFGVPALYIANSGVLSLYSSGQTSGTTIESGEGMTYFVPIIDGCPLLQSTVQMDIAGQDLTSYLLQLLADSRNLLVSTADREFVRDMKEKCCYVALDFDLEKSKDSLLPCQDRFLLPDGQEITLRQEHFLCPEVLFQPNLIGRNSLGMPMTVFRCISSCNPRHWKALFSHIILSGGTGSCTGLRSRLQREIDKLVCPAFNTQVYTSPYAKYGAWVGGSILCSLSTFKDMWVTNKEYKDMGSSAVSRRSL